MIVISPARASALATAGQADNPFLAWENLGASATVTGTTPITGGEVANCLTTSTYDKYRAVENGGGFVILSFDFGTATEISLASLAAHNLFTLGASVEVQRSPDASTWTDGGAGLVTPDDNSPIVWRMATGVSARYWRFVVSDIPTGLRADIGVAFLGNDLVIPRRFYQGFSPVITPTEVELQSNVSVGNELLGASVIGRGSSLSVSLTYVPETFVRGDDWIAFQRYFNDGGPAFFGWRPDKYPQDVYYMWRSGGVIRPTNSGPRDLMAIEMAAQVHNAA